MSVGCKVRRCGSRKASRSPHKLGDVGLAYAWDRSTCGDASSRSVETPRLAARRSHRQNDEAVREITSSVDTSNGNCGESVYKWEFDKGDASLEIAANGSLL